MFNCPCGDLIKQIEPTRLAKNMTVSYNTLEDGNHNLLEKYYGCFYNNLFYICCYWWYNFWYTKYVY